MSGGINGPRNTYFITTNKGILRLDPDGLHWVIKLELYGCAIAGSKVLMGFYVGRDGILVEGSASALFSPGAPFNFREVFQERTSDESERLHQITSCGETVWIARTAAGAGLRFDPTSRTLTNYTLLRDFFGTPVSRDVNHINSIVQYGDTVLFTAARAGNQSLIGVLDGTRVTGFGYKNPGVHDIYLTPSGFLFFDTFGANRPGEGGAAVTESGPMLDALFSKPPGYVLRGAAQNGEEILFGTSHKGERKFRFKGNGQVLILENNTLRTIKSLPAAQVYQIMNAEGAMLSPPQTTPTAAKIRGMFEQALGKAIYDGDAVVSEIALNNSDK